MNGKVESSARGGEPENKTNRRNFATKLFLLVIHTYTNNANCIGCSYKHVRLGYLGSLAAARPRAAQV